MSMKTDLEDVRRVRILVNQDENITVFPISKSNEMSEDGEHYLYLPAMNPIEIQAPYTVEELALAIQQGIEDWNCYEAYEGKTTFEEKYYGVKGFKKAIIGKKYMSLGWDDISGKTVSLMLPLKRGYGYMGIESIELPDDADYLDFAQAVIDLLNMDLSNHHRFKTYRSKLLL